MGGKAVRRAPGITAIDGRVAHSAAAALNLPPRLAPPPQRTEKALNAMVSEDDVPRISTRSIDNQAFDGGHAPEPNGTPCEEIINKAKADLNRPLEGAWRRCRGRDRIHAPCHEGCVQFRREFPGCLLICYRSAETAPCAQATRCRERRSGRLSTSFANNAAFTCRVLSSTTSGPR